VPRAQPHGMPDVSPHPASGGDGCNRWSEKEARRAGQEARQARGL